MIKMLRSIYLERLLIKCYLISIPTTLCGTSCMSRTWKQLLLSQIGTLLGLLLGNSSKKNGIKILKYRMSNNPRTYLHHWICSNVLKLSSSTSFPSDPLSYLLLEGKAYVLFIFPVYNELLGTQ